MELQTRRTVAAGKVVAPTPGLATIPTLRILRQQTTTNTILARPRPAVKTVCAVKVRVTPAQAGSVCADQARGPGLPEEAVLAGLAPACR
jgi:hypothetical protein